MMIHASGLNLLLPYSALWGRGGLWLNPRGMGEFSIDGANMEKKSELKTVANIARKLIYFGKLEFFLNQSIYDIAYPVALRIIKIPKTGSSKSYVKQHQDVLANYVASKLKEIIAEKQSRKEPTKVGPKKSTKFCREQEVASKDFLLTFEWRKVRMQALKLHGAKCQCCGASPKTGAVLNVDHVKPRKFFPELALDINNLQVLCNECNHGKGNWDTTDWR